MAESQHLSSLAFFDSLPTQPLPNASLCPPVIPGSAQRRVNNATVTCASGSTPPKVPRLAVDPRRNVTLRPSRLGERATSDSGVFSLSFTRSIATQQLPSSVRDNSSIPSVASNPLTRIFTRVERDTTRSGDSEAPRKSGNPPVAGGSVDRSSGCHGIASFVYRVRGYRVKNLSVVVRVFVK
jgi:hypothetical protein